MKWLSKIYGYDALLARLSDKDKEIERLSQENKELRDRLFIKHQLPVTEPDVADAAKGTPLPGYLTKRQRLKEYIASQESPAIVSLSEEEMKTLRAAAQ